MILYILQEFDFNMESFLTPLLDVGILLCFMILMVYLYSKFRIFPLVLLTALISLIIGVVSIDLQYNPFTPFFQVFFILFQTLFFVKTSIDLFQEVNKRKK